LGEIGWNRGIILVFCRDNDLYRTSWVLVLLPAGWNTSKLQVYLVDAIYQTR